MEHTFTDATVILDRLTKTSRAWNLWCWGSKQYLCNWYVGRATPKGRRAWPRYGTHEDSDGLLTKHLLSGSVERVKAVGSHSRAAESDSKKEANYLNNQGVSGPLDKETKVKTIKEITIMTKMVIEIESKGKGRTRAIEVGCIYHQVVAIMLKWFREAFHGSYDG